MKLLTRWFMLMEKLCGTKNCSTLEDKKLKRIQNPTQCCEKHAFFSSTATLGENNSSRKKIYATSLQRLTSPAKSLKLLAFPSSIIGDVQESIELRN